MRRVVLLGVSVSRSGLSLGLPPLPQEAPCLRRVRSVRVHDSAVSGPAVAPVPLSYETISSPGDQRRRTGAPQGECLAPGLTVRWIDVEKAGCSGVFNRRGSRHGRASKSCASSRLSPCREPSLSRHCRLAPC